MFTATTTTGVGCSDGTVQPHFRSTIITSPITLTEIYNGSADKVTGWTLGAKGASVITEANTYGTSSSGRFPNYATICADHGSVTNPFATFGAEPQRRDIVQVQQHARQHRGQPVRGPGRLIYRITSSPSRFGGAGCFRAPRGRRLIRPHHSSPRPHKGRATTPRLHANPRVEGSTSTRHPRRDRPIPSRSDRIGDGRNARVRLGPPSPTSPLDSTLHRQQVTSIDELMAATGYAIVSNCKAEGTDAGIRASACGRGGQVDRLGA